MGNTLVDEDAWFYCVSIPTRIEIDNSLKISSAFVSIKQG
jgi:hypothetical protein